MAGTVVMPALARTPFINHRSGSSAHLRMSCCRAGSMMMRQIHFASVDLELHSRFKPGSSETVFDADRRIAQRTQVADLLPCNLPSPGRTVPAVASTDVESILAAPVKLRKSGAQVMPPLPEDRFLCGFSHIFAGGYSAGYFRWVRILYVSSVCRPPPCCCGVGNA